MPVTHPRSPAGGYRRPVAGAMALAVMVGMSLLGGCGKEPGGDATQTAIAPDKNPPPEVPAVWPLTGLPGEVVERPAVAVKVENPKAARPQAGLEQADLVWEEMVEGGESRFIVVFNSQLPEAVGPVRSIRPMDGPILGPTHGLLACSGGQDRFISRAKAAGLQVLTEDSGGRGFFRSNQRSMPHNLYGRPADLLAAADSSHGSLPAAEFAFADSPATATAAKDGRPAATMAVKLSAVAKPKWAWEETSGTYLRSEGDTPSESADGVRLAARNVIALTVDIKMAGGTDAAGSPIPETIIVGSGEGIVMTGGKALDIQWSKASEGDPLVLKTPDGSVVTLAPGITWIELVPKTDGSWSVS